MPEMIQISVNGQTIKVEAGCTVAGAIAQARHNFFRRSVTGEERAPLCGMGICFECRVTVNGQPQVRSCQFLCEPGLEVVTDEKG